MLVSLFLSAFLAATILPAQSEVMLTIAYFTNQYPAWLLVGIATAGNVLGALVNWLLGGYFVHFKDRRWFPASEASMEKAERFYTRYGVWTLLLAWVPVIGDPLTLIAGVFRTPLRIFLPLVTLGKFARYTALLLLV